MNITSEERAKEIINDSDVVVTFKSGSHGLVTSGIFVREKNCSKELPEEKRDRYEIILDKPSRKFFHTKIETKLKQVGLVQRLNIEALAENAYVDVQVVFPQEIPEMSDVLKGSLKENSSLMAKKGCSVKFRSINGTEI